jgi:hypothetical protein
MTLKVVVPARISKAINGFRLPRRVMIQLVSGMHHDIPRDHHEFRQFRVEDDERTYTYRIAIRHENCRHLFTMAIDDSTAPPDRLIVASIRHDTRLDDGA